jgi:histidyl-tRNA synthetase
LLLGAQGKDKPQAFVVSTKGEAALQLATQLRRAGFSCEMDYPAAGSKMRAFNKQLEKSNKSGAQWTLILGEDELASKQVSVKNMADGTQTKMAAENLITFLLDAQLRQNQS